VKSWENLTRKSYRLSTSPVRCSHCTLGNRKKVNFNSIIHIYFWLFTLFHKKTICNPLVHPTWKLHHTNLWIAKLFIWPKVCCVLSDVGGSEKSQLWVVTGGSEKNRLWCVATGMSGKQCHSKCSNWPPSSIIHASSFFDTIQSRSTPRCAKIQPTSLQAAAASLNTSISIHALLL